MSSAVTLVKLTSKAVARILMGEGALGMTLTSKNGIASQAKPTDASSYSHNSGDTPSDKLDVLVHKSRNELKVNLEKILSNDVQEEVIGQLQSFINTTVTEEKIPNITFNHIAEDVYLQNLHMTFRKLGYHSMFTRYNGDRGMAVFQKKDPDEPNVRRNVYRSRKPNIC